MESDEQDTGAQDDEAEEFDPEEIEDDPAYNPPDDDHARDLKGG